MHHLRRLVPGVSVERPISHIGRTLRHLGEHQNLFETGTLNRQLRAGLEHSHPLFQDALDIPRPEVFDDVNRPRLVGVVIGERERLRNVRDNVRRYGFVVPNVYTDPAVLSLVARPEVKSNTSIHFAAIKFGLNVSDM